MKDEASTYLRVSDRKFPFRCRNLHILKHRHPEMSEDFVYKDGDYLELERGEG